jgi:hypothetical protein
LIALRRPPRLYLTIFRGPTKSLTVLGSKFGENDLQKPANFQAGATEPTKALRYTNNPTGANNRAVLPLDAVAVDLIGTTAETRSCTATNSFV